MITGNREMTPNEQDEWVDQQASKLPRLDAGELRHLLTEQLYRIATEEHRRTDWCDSLGYVTDGRVQ